MNRDKEQGKTPNMGIPALFLLCQREKCFLVNKFFIDKCRLLCIIHIKAML